MSKSGSIALPKRKPGLSRGDLTNPNPKSTVQLRRPPSPGKTIAATITPDEVPVPSRARSGSFSAAVADLGIGECTCRAFLINPEKTLAELVGDLSELREKCRDNTTPAVRQAREKVGGEYAIEMATTTTPAGRFYIVAIVTRLV